jgi:hypothetical protein
VLVAWRCGTSILAILFGFALAEVRHGTAEFAICDIESWTSLVFAIAISEKAM